MNEFFVDAIKSKEQNYDDKEEYYLGIKYGKIQITMKCQHCHEDTVTSTRTVIKRPIYGPAYRSDSEADVRHDSLLDLRCDNCWRTVALRLCDTWWEINDLLKTSDESRTGWKLVKSFAERVALYVLNCIIQKQLELCRHVTFLTIKEDEIAKLLWVDHEAVGFYTIKSKGSPYMLFEHYYMPVVDLIFIRQKARRRGHAMRLIDDLLSMFPEEDVGFSDPISDEMYLVLEKYLKQNPKFKDRLWECRHFGGEGLRRNIWLHLKCLSAEKTEDSKKRKLSDEVDEKGTSSANFCPTG